MELTIATLNEILLPPFLFLVVFCFLCCHLPRPRYSTATIQLEAEDGAIAIPQQKTSTVEEILLEQEPSPATTPAVEEPAASRPQPDTTAFKDLREDVLVEKDAPETVASAEPISSQQTELEAQVLAIIDNLGKREARKLMGGLRLQQKRNGVELSTELMVASIRREFKADPERVIEVMSDRLPELLPATTTPIQLAS
jgi:hypothetical protein